MADVARCQAYPADSQSFQFVGNINVFRQGCDGLGLINTHFQFERPPAHYSSQMAIHSGRVSHNTAILCGSSQEVFSRERQLESSQIDRALCEISFECSPICLEVP